MTRFDNRDYVSMTMEFRCNLQCVHCMIEGTMDRLRPESDARFDELLAVNAREARWKGLILTGSEITLRKDLLELAKRARQAGFSHVRIQSHGMALEQESFCEALLDAGVDEFFISIAGSDAPRHDEITTVPGSFEKTLRGLENLDRLGGATVLTNTVITRRSADDLPAIVDVLAHIKCLAQMEFWNYWPMREDDEKDLIAPLGLVTPQLRLAVAKAQSLGRSIEIKNMPQCMLGSDAALLVNQQPHLYVDEAFWAEFGRNGFYQCVYRERCGSTECLGLTTAYIRKFGWEDGMLAPIAQA
ncbi:radical SAM protein [Methyloferula stellata]|uniref:radical SAM protein n=1 Tax=Methyloferula stellata TaxID=876270 RepID=UPI0003634D40|nr:radical SAM protein [Methyloferula stellata]